MAVCLKSQVVWVPITNAATPRYQMTVYVPDTVTPVESCSTVLVSGSDANVLSRVLITNAADAQEIAGAFMLLIVGVGLYRLIRRQIEDSNFEPSDEKH